YLDTHPTDTKAIAEYNAIINEAAKLRAEYEQKHGSLTASKASPTDRFTWIDEPWSWEETYN
ncbi:MAG: spore coat protein CotJB, partial [Clostridiales bacterium]|nr:spore coat protein CotJB [Clostridiales bacterium]